MDEPLNDRQVSRPEDAGDATAMVPPPADHLDLPPRYEGLAPPQARWPVGPPPPPPEHAVPRGWGVPPPAPDVTPPSWPAAAPAARPDASTLPAQPAEVIPHPDQPQQRARAGRREASGCALGTVLIGVLSKLALAAKVLAPLLSALVSLAAYAALFGWQFGVGILALLFVHEMGHFVVIRAKGLPASLPIFIPLLGAYVAMRRLPENVRDQAEIAIAGPLVGALGGVVCLLVYQETGSRLWLVMAYFSFLINLLNLIPIAPLDGGRIVDAISRWFLLPGLALVTWAFFYTHSVLLLVLLFLGAMQAWSRFSDVTDYAAYYRIPLLSRAYVTVLYFGLAAGLALGMVAAQNLLVPGAGGVGM